MPKGSPPPLIDDPDLLAPKVALDENPEVKTSNKKPPNPRSTPPTPTTAIDSNVQTAASSMLNSIPGSSFAGSMAPPTPSFGSVQSSASNTQQPVSPQVALAQLELDKILLKKQLGMQDESWVKTYWRPAMGWLYMVICFMDFVGFPLLTIFLPIIFKPFGLTVPYQVWQSLTLANGGLIHLSFGAILGVAAWTRGQEKIQGKA